MTDFDCIIVGAGAAGIAAARTLHDAGLRVVVLEASDRIGGRTHTAHDIANFPVELGAEFIHGDNAITHELVKQAGLHTIPVDRMNKLRWGRPAVPLAAASDETREIIEALHHDYTALKDADLPEDVSLAAYFAALGHDVVALRIADVLYGQTCCARLDDLSCHDLQREMRVDTSGGEWGGEARIAEGYGALFAWYSRDLDLRLHHPVTQIRRTADGVIVHAGGKHKRADFQARTCLLTIPVAVLQRDKIKFEPPLSSAKWEAIRAFKVEAATKIILRYEYPFWDDDLTYMANDWMAVRWWTPGHGRADADALLTCYLTADKAARVDDISVTAAIKMGRMIIAQMLEDPGVPLTNGRVVSWADAIYARGGYAHLPPGHADARLALAASEDRLFFAGEATAHDSNPQTVHGAIESGLRAAREIIDYHQVVSASIL
ncbi:MAG: NAD(P)/FAD-dependent oxidoreductase [Chloroflexota bacterium]|nr:NAD(P)/FAD-dependent oxidoreductase [Chloroflexota bacterium]